MPSTTSIPPRGPALSNDDLPEPTTTSISSSSLKTAVFTAFMILTTTFYVAGTVTNIASHVAKTISLWSVCSSANSCTSDFSSTCSEGASVITASKAMCISASILAGLCMFTGFYDFFYPTVLPKSFNMLFCVVTAIVGLVAMCLAWVMFAASICSGTQSFADQNYELGPHAPLLVFGFIANSLALTVECCAPITWTTETERAERERKKKEAKRKGMAMPPKSVPSSSSNPGTPTKRSQSHLISRGQNEPIGNNNNNTGRSGSQSNISVIRPPPSPRNTFQQQQFDDDDDNRFQQQQQQQRNHPGDGDWILDDDSGLYWSEEQQLWYDDQTGYFIDPVSGQSYDPVSGEWSG